MVEDSIDMDNSTEIKPAPVETIAQVILEFNQNIDLSIEDLTRWKSELASKHEQFVEKLKTMTLAMKVQ